MDDEFKKSIDALIEQEKKSNSLRMSFLRGVFSGFGFFVGSVLLVALFIYILSFFDTAPIVGRWIGNIVNTITKK